MLQIPEDLKEFKIEMAISFMETFWNMVMIFVMFYLLMPMDGVEGCERKWWKKAVEESVIQKGRLYILPLPWPPVPRPN